MQGFRASEWGNEGFLKDDGKDGLRDRIEAICLEFPRYGYRRITQALKREGLRVNHKKVLRLMKESDLLCQVKCKWKKTTDSRHHFPRYPNLVKAMAIKLLNQVWLSDITYIRIRTGFVYLAAILDAFSRKVIGYAVSMSLDTTITLRALRMAIARTQSWPWRHPSFRPRSTVRLN
jgi:transposase InsO family protein